MSEPVKPEEIRRLVTPQQINIVEDDLLDILRPYSAREREAAPAQELLTRFRETIEDPAFGLWIMLRHGCVAALMVAHIGNELGAGVLAESAELYVDLLEIVPQRVEDVTAAVKAMLDAAREWARELQIDKIVHISHHVQQDGDPQRLIRKRFCRSEGRPVGTVIEIHP